MIYKRHMVSSGMPVVIYKPERTQVVDGRTRTITKHEQWYVRDTTKDFHTKYGVIPKEKLVPGDFKINSEEYYVVPATFLDGYKGMKRLAQIITRKDIGFIIGYCGLTRDSVVVESGGGSGGATLMLAQVCKSVFTYEISRENISVIADNLDELNIENVTVFEADFYKDLIEPHDADLVLLDLPEPWKAYKNTQIMLKLGGYVVAYTPTIVQAQQFANELPENFILERTVEIIDRDWKVKGKAVRPVSGDIGHTAFLTFARRIN